MGRRGDRGNRRGGSGVDLLYVPSSVYVYRHLYFCMLAFSMSDSTTCLLNGREWAGRVTFAHTATRNGDEGWRHNFA